MERLMFVCPATGENVGVDFESEIGTLLRIRTRTVRALCPACGEEHEWPVRDARLSEPSAASPD
jgi:hypothetical protein